MAAKRDSAALSIGSVVVDDDDVVVVAVVVGKSAGATTPSAMGRCKSGDNGISSNVPSPSNSSITVESCVGF